MILINYKQLIQIAGLYKKPNLYWSKKFRYIEKEPNFNEIDERLAEGWYVHSFQRKRYLKSLIKDKK